jgi:hypothetical protein
MQRGLELEERLCGAWSALGTELHAEDAFVCSWLRWLSPPAELRELARELALVALDQVDGPEGSWQRLSLRDVVRDLRAKDGGSGQRVAFQFVAWLTDAGWIEKLPGQEMLDEIELRSRGCDRNKCASLAA